MGAGQTATALDFVTPGTALAGYPLVVDANKAVDTLTIATLKTGAGAGTAVTATAAELNVLAGVTPGTAAASKGVVLDANASFSGLLQPLGVAATGQSLAILQADSNATAVASGTVQNTEYDLISYTLPANSLNALARGLEITAWGTTAANANAKTFKMYFGGTVICTATGNTANAQPYFFRAFILRIAAGSQTIMATLTIGTTLTTTTITAGTLDETATLVVKTSSINTAAAAASATGQGQIVNYIP